jgi:hypothetical protein
VTPEETQRFQEICTQIIAEKDETQFAELVRKLDAIMQQKEQRLHDKALHSSPAEPAL